MKKIVIPRKIKKKLRSTNGILKGEHNYTYIGESKYLVMYRCEENGATECFQKKDFLVDTGTDKAYPFKGTGIEGVY